MSVKIRPLLHSNLREFAISTLIALGNMHDILDQGFANVDAEDDDLFYALDSVFFGVIEAIGIPEQASWLDKLWHDLAKNPQAIEGFVDYLFRIVHNSQKDSIASS